MLIAVRGVPLSLRDRLVIPVFIFPGLLLQKKSCSSFSNYTIQEALQGHSPGISGPAFGILCRCKIVLLSIRHHLPKVLHCPLYIQKPIKTLVSLIKPSYPGLYVLARAANNSRRILVYQWEYTRADRREWRGLLTEPGEILRCSMFPE